MNPVALERLREHYDAPGATEGDIMFLIQSEIRKEKEQDPDKVHYGLTKKDGEYIRFYHIDGVLYTYIYKNKLNLVPVSDESTMIDGFPNPFTIFPECKEGAKLYAEMKEKKEFEKYKEEIKKDFPDSSEEYHDFCAYVACLHSYYPKGKKSRKLSRPRYIVNSVFRDEEGNINRIITTRGSNVIIVREGKTGRIVGIPKILT